MSGKKIKQARKQVEKVEKAKGDRPPKIDPARKRVNLQQLDNAFGVLTAQSNQLSQKLSNAVRQLHQNDVELKGGLDASEFNLRSHQKALNAIALELERIRTLLLDTVGNLPDSFKESYLRLADVTVGPEGEQQVVRRVDWPYYHAEVDKDLKALAEMEKAAAEAEKAAAEAAKKEAPPSAVEEPLPDKNPELPEGAAVFGG